MLDADVRSWFARNPTPVYLISISVLALFALQASPAFVPLVLLLTILRLFVVHVVVREKTFSKVITTIICLAISTTIANIGPSLNAIPFARPAVAVASLFLLTCATSSVLICTVLLDARFRPSIHRVWAHFLLFPTIWATALQLAALISPLGYIAIWTPVFGVGAYSWLRPFLGSTGIDWAVGAWAVVLSELIGMWIMGPGGTLSVTKGGENNLIDVGDDDAPGEFVPDKIRRSPRLFFVTAILCVAAVPSYFIRSLPIPVNSKTTTHLSVACALPLSDDPIMKPSLADYVLETHRLRGEAKLVLWPEGAVRFHSEEEKLEAIDAIAEHADRSLIGVSFEDYTNTTGLEGKIRNGFMLMDRQGPIFEYYKRHLVPFIESDIMVPYHDSPPVYDYELVIRESSRKKPLETLSVPITASICLDFAHPNIFSNLDMRPSLILAPASTWHESIGVAMWQQALARAEEVGSALMFCDGGAEGISGIGLQGSRIGDIVQVGRGSWTAFIGFEKDADNSRTVYGVTGPWLSMVLIWCALGAERIVELIVSKIRGSQSQEMSAVYGIGFVKAGFARFQEWRRARLTGEQNERTPLI